MKVMNRKKRSELRKSILENNLMMRFIREIEREEQLDSPIMETMLVYQPIRIR